MWNIHRVTTRVLFYNDITNIIDHHKCTKSFEIIIIALIHLLVSLVCQHITINMHRVSGIGMWLYRTNGADCSSLPFHPLQWRHNDHNGVSNHQAHGFLLNRLFRRRSKKTSKLRFTGLFVGNSPGPVTSPHKGPVARKMFPFDDVIMTAGLAQASIWMSNCGSDELPYCTNTFVMGFSIDRFAERANHFARIWPSVR